MKHKNKTPKKYNFISLLACFAIVYVFCSISGMFVSDNIDTAWYNAIKPEITPPEWIFPLVWHVLYFLIAVSIWFAWSNAHHKEKKCVIVLYGINLVAGAMWTYLFFRVHNPLLAFIDIAVLWLSIVAIIADNWNRSKTACLLLFPYILWVSFVAVLNYISI